MSVKLTNEEITEPDQQYWDSACVLIEVDDEESEGEDSEEDGVEEERKVSSSQTDVVLDGLLAGQLCEGVKKMEFIYLFHDTFFFKNKLI